MTIGIPISAFFIETTDEPIINTLSGITTIKIAYK